jgi:hypothetical protein
VSCDHEEDHIAYRFVDTRPCGELCAPSREMSIHDISLNLSNEAICRPSRSNASPFEIGVHRTRHPLFPLIPSSQTQNKEISFQENVGERRKCVRFVTILWGETCRQGVLESARHLIHGPTSCRRPKSGSERNPAYARDIITSLSTGDRIEASMLNWFMPSEGAHGCRGV